MPAETEVFTGGFADPVLSAQSAFRTLMDAMAGPARVVSVVPEAEAPFPACRAMAAIALTLADHETAVWLSPMLAASAFPRWLSFHTGAAVGDDRMAADFVFFARTDGFPDLSGVALGSDAYPDRAATLVVEVEALVGGEPLVARGPGIRDAQTLAPMGLPGDFLAAWSLNRSLYPRGIDLILVCGADILCLPRTTRLAKREA